MKHNHQHKLLAERTQDRPSRQRVSIMSALRYRAERFGAQQVNEPVTVRMKPFGNSCAWWIRAKFSKNGCAVSRVAPDNKRPSDAGTPRLFRTWNPEAGIRDARAPEKMVRSPSGRRPLGCGRDGLKQFGLIRHTSRWVGCGLQVLGVTGRDYSRERSRWSPLGMANETVEIGGRWLLSLTNNRGTTRSDALATSGDRATSAS
jgi:hypothetical protein